LENLPFIRLKLAVKRCDDKKFSAKIEKLHRFINDIRL